MKYFTAKIKPTRPGALFPFTGNEIWVDVTEPISDELAAVAITEKLRKTDSEYCYYTIATYKQ